MDRKAHWDFVYSSRSADQVSWFEADPALSLELITRFCPPKRRVIDVGGGESRLVDRLLESGFDRPAVLDVSAVAIEHAKERLGPRAREVDCIVADVTETPGVGRFDLWHDRAVFHFLTSRGERERYIELARRTVQPGAHLLLATFAPDGPSRCSGLDVCRYDGASAAVELGAGFELACETRRAHLTPQGKPQQFFYGVFRRVD